MIAGRQIALLGRELSRLGRSEWTFLARTGILGVALWMVARQILGYVDLDPRILQQISRTLFPMIAMNSTCIVGVVAMLVSGAVTLSDRRGRMHDLLLLSGYRERTVARARVVASSVALGLAPLVLLPVVAAAASVGGVEPEQILALAFSVAVTCLWASSLGVLIGAVSRDHVLMTAFVAVVCVGIVSVSAELGPRSGALAWTTLLLSPGGGLAVLADSLFGFRPWAGPGAPAQTGELLTAACGAALAAIVLPALAGAAVRASRAGPAGGGRGLRDRRRPQRVARRWKGEPGSNPVSFRANRLAGLAGDRRHIAAAAAILVGIVLLLEAIAATRPDRLESYPAVLAQIYGWLGLVAGGIVLPFAAFRLIRPERDSGVLLLLYATPVPHGSLTWGRLRPPVVLAALLALPWLTQVSLDLLVDAVPLEAVAMSIAVLVCTWLALGYLGLASALAFRGELASVGVPLAVVIGYCALRVYQSHLSYHHAWDAGWRFRTFELPFLTLGCESWPGVKRRWIEGEALVPVLTDLAVLSLSAFVLHVLCSGVLLRRAVERS